MFSKKLVASSSSYVIAELYDFLLASDIGITDDGKVRCWKRVGSDYKDLYSGKFDNTPGCICEVPRVSVDTDRTKTCSYGLHVCSAAYLPSYGSKASGNRIVEVLVEPSDFISIPDEYYSNENGVVTAKARVCKYEVIRDVTDEFDY